MAMAQEWLAMGHSVTWFAGGFGVAPEDAMLRGVRIIRRGRPWSVHWQAFLAYQRGEFRDVDLVVDQIHGIGFFTPLYFRAPRVALIHEVAGAIWRAMYPLPVALLGLALEAFMLKAYRGTPFITGAESAKQELATRGIPRDQIEVVRWGNTVSPPEVLPEKAEIPTVISVGRICAMKRTIEVIEAVALLRAHQPDSQLWLVGGGDERYLGRCRERAAELGIAGAVRFFGFVTEEEKHELMGRAWVLVSASMKEGWGLIVGEANALGTPASTYDVPGFRESVAAGWGVLAEGSGPPALTAAMLKALHLARPAAVTEAEVGCRRAAEAVCKVAPRASGASPLVAGPR